MSIETKWAEDLSRETLRKFIEIGDGHTLFDPETYIEIGIPQDVVDHYTRTHVSPKRPHPDAVEALAHALGDESKKVISENEWSERDLARSLISDDGCFAEDFAEQLIVNMIDNNVERVFGYHPKEAMWDGSGNVIESLEAVYGLEITRGLCSSLSLKADGKLGRGSQYDAYCKAIRGYISEKEVS